MIGNMTPRPCPGSGLRIGARFVVRNSENEYVTTCPTCEQTIKVRVTRVNQPWPQSPMFVRNITDHNRFLYLGGNF